MAWYAGTLQQSWWTYTYQKYHHQALKLAHGPQSDSSSGLVLPRILSRSPEIFNDGVMNGVFGQELFQWLIKTALPQLERAGQLVIFHYMTALMHAAAESRILVIRFRYEAQAWYVQKMLFKLPTQPDQPRWEGRHGP